MFTRFKTPVKQEQPDLEMAVSAPVDELKPDETVIDMVGNISLHHSSGTPSITTGAGGNTLEHRFPSHHFKSQTMQRYLKMWVNGRIRATGSQKAKLRRKSNNSNNYRYQVEQLVVHRVTIRLVQLKNFVFQ